MVMVVMMIVMMMMTIMMMMMTIMIPNLHFDIKHIQDLSHLVSIINIVTLSDLHISSFAQTVVYYPLRRCPH